MEPGLKATREFVVTHDDTAETLLSGDLPVLGTPRLVAWLEAATCAAVRENLGPGQTTVGKGVAVEHRAASSVGEPVSVVATLVQVDGSVLVFDVAAIDRATGALLGQGTITRAVVDRERFLSRVARSG